MHTITGTTYSSLDLGLFSLVLAQIFWLDFHSSSASLIFTYTLKRFNSHFLQHAVLDYESPLSDIYICPECLQQTPGWRSNPLYQKYFSWLSFILFPLWSSLDHGVALQWDYSMAKSISVWTQVLFVINKPPPPPNVRGRHHQQQERS